MLSMCLILRLDVWKSVLFLMKMGPSPIWLVLPQMTVY